MPLGSCNHVGWSVFAFVDKHQRLKSEADSYRKPVEETLQWSNVEELGEIENKSYSCILIQLQGTNSTQRNTFHEQPAVAQSQDEKGLNKHLCHVAWRKMAGCS